MVGGYFGKMEFPAGPRRDPCMMSRKLTLLFRRDPSADRVENDIPFEGYKPLWPDLSPVQTGLDAFCKHGQRLLGLGRALAGRQERLIDLHCFPLTHREASLTRIPGFRIRRFSIRRTGTTGRIHFLDGTPTSIVLKIGHDEAKVCNWIGLTDIQDGDELWIDIAAAPTQEAPRIPATYAVGVGAGTANYARSYQ